MKNKHIVLVFCLTLLIGVALRYAPWLNRETLQSGLACVPVTDIGHILLQRPGQPETVLAPADQGWLASTDELTLPVPDSIMTPLLAALSEQRTLRIVHSRQLDSLGLLPGQAIHVELLLRNGRRERFDIGRELPENGQPATCLRLESHNGIYLTSGYLRHLFMITPEAFRNKNLLSLDEAGLSAIRLYRIGCDTLAYEKLDSVNWKSSAMPPKMIGQAEVLRWLGRVKRLNGLPFASSGEQSSIAERPDLCIEFQSPANEPALLEFFGISCTRLTDGTPRVSPLADCVVHSSQNPYNYFEVRDTAALQVILQGIPEMPADSLQ